MLANFHKTNNARRKEDTGLMYSLFQFPALVLQKEYGQDPVKLLHTSSKTMHWKNQPVENIPVFEHGNLHLNFLILLNEAPRLRQPPELNLKKDYQNYFLMSGFVDPLP